MMTAANPTLPGLFGNMGQKKTPKDMKPQTPGTNKVFFFGKDFHSAIEFLEGIGITPNRSWNCVHNKAGIDGVSNALVYVCPCATQHKEYQNIMDTLWQQKGNRMIVIAEAKSDI